MDSSQPQDHDGLKVMDVARRLDFKFYLNLYAFNITKTSPQQEPLIMSKFAVPHGPASIVIKIVVIVLALAFIKEQAALLPDLPFQEGSRAHNMRLVTAFLLSLLPAGSYLCAVWAASNVFGRMNKGDPFEPAIVKGLKEVGTNLMWGAAAAIFIVPTLTPMLNERFRGFRYDPNIESVTIGLVGLVLYILAKQGQALKAELEQFV
jgi:hypothetical protein